jgi:hypothetical protein
MQELDEQYVKKFLTGQKVLILGSAACVKQLDVTFMESFPIIVRSNNYKVFNSCKRTDIYYSFLGGSIKKSMDDIIEDGAKFIFCRCPDTNFNRNNGINIAGRSFDARAIYKNRKDWFKIPYFIQTIKNYESNYELCNRLLTTGVSSIIDILRYSPELLYVAGFDFFTQKIHNVDEPCRPNLGHNFAGEFNLIKKLWENKQIEISKEMQKLFEINKSWDEACKWKN